MGMESYFVKLRPEHENIFKDMFIESLGKYGISVQERNDILILGEFFILRVQEKDGYLVEMSVEGCLSWFEKGLERCFEFFEIIDREIVPMQVTQPDGTVLPLSKEIFITRLKDFYKDKYQRFLETYGDIDVRSLPDKQFYDYIEKSRNKSFIKRIFRK
ncbi:hypothetical protein SAMN02799630_04937 [Paenibacillus sp. UNCCL117]|uniref:hypothetical protein n=1 Tax=unclassified Paenibacillus TaxID=185978 RepID=UPI00087FE843|nr:MULTISPECIES: hypothetical protein [unclassified Paenibacillus]SDE19897.1 hypothetical protein SAMN04488602_12151 [Paenibacillus sp. cl123]SFW61911.1 hypothetical protein SAMN02799630_04937 [Paenibacillus sp. UNCCL117]